MDSKKTIGDYLSGKGREYIPDMAFWIMTFIMKIMDVFGNHALRNFKNLKLNQGQVVIDYGCGPARYIKDASKAVGTKGMVYAVDIHPLAIRNVNKKISKYKLKNVKTVLANGYSCSIPDKIADVIYALDMFHMIEQPTMLLKEFKRMIKPDGIIIIEDGHQLRAETKQKIEKSGLLTVLDECKSYVKCSLKS